VVRTYYPGAKAAAVVAEADGAMIAMEPVDPAGLFAVFLPGRKFPFRYRTELFFSNGQTTSRVDPYRFAPTLGELDLHLCGEGRHYRLYEKLGAHLQVVDGSRARPSPSGPQTLGGSAWWVPSTAGTAACTRCAPWAPRHLGDFHPRGGSRQPVQVRAQDRRRNLRLKTDPLAFAMELRPSRPRWSGGCPSISGVTWTGWRTAGAVSSGRSPWLSTRCISARG